MEPKKKPKFRYDDNQMVDAIAAVTNGDMSKKAAAKQFGVPRSTLQDKIAGRTPINRKMGKDPFLSAVQESEIVEWVYIMGFSKLS